MSGERSENGLERDEYRVGYELGAQTPDEARAFEDLAAELGSADPIVPPPELKASILARISSLSQDGRSTEDESMPRTPAVRRTAGGPGGAAEARARRSWFTRPVGILAASAAAIVLFAGGVVAGRVIVGPSQQQAAAAVAEVIVAADARAITQPIEGGGSATVIASESLSMSAILVSDLTPAPPDKAYELWYIHNGEATPAGLLPTESSGTAWRVLDGSLVPGATVGMTLEPAGGSQQPTTQPIFAVELAS